MRGSLRSRRGVALVELMVAAVILALCVVPITGTIAFVRANAAEARTQAEVQALMQSAITTRLDGGKLVTLVQTIVPVTTTHTLKSGVTATLNVSVTPVSGYKDLFEVACVATYKASSAADRTDTLTLSTYAISS